MPPIYMVQRRSAARRKTMDYYEEFGVDQTAGPEEIRLAYKRLVRLLHPDRCRDNEVKRLADIQMKRLNGILQILTDPGRRGEYDRRLLEPPDTRQHHRRQETHPPLWFWAAATVMILIGFLLLSHGQKTIPPPLAAAAPAKPEPQPAPADQPVRNRSSRVSRAQPQATPVHSEKRQAEFVPELPPLPVLSPQPYLDIASNIGGVSLKPAVVRPSDPAVRAPPRTTEAAASTGWNGDWFYVPGLQTSGPGFYTPEYIELRITQDGANLHGRYRSRYHIPDRAISPAVNFQFDGAPNGDGAVPWTGPGGARGEVKLHLLPNGVLEVAWEADQMGNELGLISGKASLVRKLD